MSERTGYDGGGGGAVARRASAVIDGHALLSQAVTAAEFDFVPCPLRRIPAPALREYRQVRRRGAASLEHGLRRRM